MSKSIWKVQPLGKPSAAHAADAIEIVNGEPVRRVTLPQMDYDVYLAFTAGQTHTHELAATLSISADAASSALNRLAASGLIAVPDGTSIQ